MATTQSNPCSGLGSESTGIGWEVSATGARVEKVGYQYESDLGALDRTEGLLYTFTRKHSIRAALS